MTDVSSDAGKYPRPVIVDYVAFLYEGFNQGELRIQHCDACGKHRHPPNPMCPFCHSPQWTARPTSGRGQVHSYTIQHYPPIPPYEAPHAVVLVDMEAGFRFLAAIKDVALADIRIGMDVEICYVELESGFTLPVFRPAERGVT